MPLSDQISRSLSDASDPSLCKTSSPQEGSCDIGVVGLAAMGASLSRNLASKGHTVAVFNRSYARTEKLMVEHGGEGAFVPAKELSDFVASLAKPRVAIIMVKAGFPTDSVIQQLAGLMEPGDIIVDAGNANFHDTILREKELATKGLHFVGMGVSGGEEGALKGPSIMPGGSKASWERLRPMLEAISAQAEGEPCVTHIGENGAGHFVKMVHNGIEYADMQLIAESYDLLHEGLGLSNTELADIFSEWNKGELDSYLISITADILKEKDARTGRDFLDVVLDEAHMKGTGTWTVQNALDLEVPVTGISEAVFARGLSAERDLRAQAQNEGLSGGSKAGIIKNLAQDPQQKQDFIESVRKALYASKIIAYAQGFSEMSVAAQKYAWDLDLGAIARIWRGGCIIRARFLNRISDAFADKKKPLSLLFDPFFKEVLLEAQDAWRSVVSHAVLAGIPVPVFASSLAYYDALRAKRLPAALIQAQRDYFGAHTYQRIDAEGAFHKLWAESSREELRW